MGASNTKTYYHIRETKLSVGEIAKGRGIGPLDDRYLSVETLLEQGRPIGHPARGDIVYMREDCDFQTVGVTFDEGYVHEVEPIGIVDRRDLSWIGELQRRHNKISRLLKPRHPELSDAQVAAKYWSGEASENPTWEWVAKEVRVIAVEDQLSRVRPCSPLLDALTTKWSGKP